MADPSSIRILVTNDDGIHAPGLEVLEGIARELSDDVWTVAPETEQSGKSHSLTLHEPLRARELAPMRLAVTGTPTDCVGLAVKYLLTDKKPDLVLSGVNRGSNIADDVTYSGTVAGAMEGCTLGIRSISLSQAYGFRNRGDGEAGAPDPVPWHTARYFGARVVAALLTLDWPVGIFWNVNFPDAEPEDVGRFEVTRQGRRDVNNLFIDAREDARGRPYFWLGFNRQLSNPPEGTDLRAIYEGRITATPLHMNLTYPDLVAQAGERLNGGPP